MRPRAGGTSAIPDNATVTKVTVKIRFRSAVGTISATRVNGWHTRAWTSGILAYINKVGVTQLRLRFATDDNNDGGADYVRFYSGDDATVSSRPMLIVEYYVP